jgi:hypothetical protein
VFEELIGLDQPYRSSASRSPGSGVFAVPRTRSLNAAVLLVPSVMLDIRVLLMM